MVKPRTDRHSMTQGGRPGNLPYHFSIIYRKRDLALVLSFVYMK